MCVCGGGPGGGTGGGGGGGEWPVESDPFPHRSRTYLAEDTVGLGGLRAASIHELPHGLSVGLSQAGVCIRRGHLCNTKREQPATMTSTTEQTQNGRELTQSFLTCNVH